MTTRTDIAPDEYDGFVTELDRGYVVSAHGRDIDTVGSFTQAKVVLAEHCADRPRWFVGRSGGYARLD